jgi:alkylated DNA nucleotide flippase Atl1
MTDFERDVLAVVKNIPHGKTMTYKQFAVLSGYPRAYRAVSNVIKKIMYC